MASHSTNDEPHSTTRTEQNLIHFDDEGLHRYLAEDPGGLVVMLNLLRFRADGGAESCFSYAERFGSTGLNERYGIEVLYAGSGSTALVAEDGQAWDMVVLVKYPSRQSFIDMIRDPKYQAIEHLRTEALLESVLQATAAAALP
jgi:uncharacterized protein (DUF1330 family)